MSLYIWYSKLRHCVANRAILKLHTPVEFVETKNEKKFMMINICELETIGITYNQIYSINCLVC